MSKEQNETQEIPLVQVLPAELKDFLLDRDTSELVLSNKSFQGNFSLIYEVLINRVRLHTAVKTRMLTRLTLNNISIGIDDFKYLRCILQNSPTCTVLDLSENNLGQIGFEEVLKAVSNTGVKHLILRNVNITANVVSVLYPYIATCTLSKIDLTQNELNSSQFFLIQFALTNPRKEELEIIIDTANFKSGFQNRNQQELVDKTDQVKTRIKALEFYNKRQREEIIIDDHKYPKIETVDSNAPQPVADKTENTNVKVAEISSSYKRQKKVLMPLDLETTKQEAYKSFLNTFELLTSTRKEQINEKIIAQYPPCELKMIQHSKQNSHYRNDCRQYSKSYPNSIFDHRFLYYPINRSSDGYHLSEGPTETSIEFLLMELLKKDCPINVILAVGNPNDGEKFFDYTQPGNYQGFSIKTIETEEKYPHIVVRQLEIQKLETKETKTIKHYHIDNRCHLSSILFNEYDNKLLYTLSKTVSPENMLVHCDTGISYAPMMILSMQLFRNFTKMFAGSTNDIAEKILTEVLRGRLYINPFLFPQANVVISALSLVYSYAELYVQDLAEKSVDFIHPNVPIKKLALLNQSEDGPLNLLLESLGVRLVNLGQLSEANLTDLKVSNSLALASKIIELFRNDEFMAIIICSNVESKSLTTLLKLIPTDILTIYFHEGGNIVKEVSSECKLVANGIDMLKITLKGLLTEKDRILQKKNSTFTKLGNLGTSDSFWNKREENCEAQEVITNSSQLTSSL